MEQQPQVRIAFVGAGRHATGSLYPNFAYIPECDLVAVCDLDEQRARLNARHFGATQYFTDVETMFAQTHPQGVCIVGPPEIHQEIGLYVLRRGIPIFIEKPPATTVENAAALVQAAQDAGTWGMTGFMKRFAPANVVAKQYMSRPDFGRLATITLIHGAGPFTDLRRMLMFNGIHMIDLGRFLGGDVDEVFAHSSQVSEGVLGLSASMRFANGAVGQLNMNSGHSWQDCFEQTYIAGSGAGLLIDASRAVEVMAQGQKFVEETDFKLFGWSSRYYVSGNMAGWEAGSHYTRGYWGELSHFVRAVAGLVAPTSTLDDALAAMRLIDAMIASAANKQPISL